jgi:dihydrofolate reductase
MGKLIFEISTSVDGYVAGPQPSDEQPLGIGGEQLHDWVFRLKPWLESHGREGGEEGPEADVVQEWIDRAGATIMGRKMFSGGEGSWDDDGNRDGWWGAEPPFHHPVFVLTHHERESQEMEGGTTFHFVTDGIEAALERAREAAGDKDVKVAGGAQAGQQYLDAGLVDEMMLHVAPVVLGGGERLFADGAVDGLDVEVARVIESPHATHTEYRVVK